MITLSTHTLDSSNGQHAEGINVSLYAIIDKNTSKEIWNKKTDKGGRLTVEFDIDSIYASCEFQLSFNIGSYFKTNSIGVQASAIALNINLPSPSGNYHFPIIISPHGASLWWSN
jgi:5-hydroxyisourate hydrolase